MINPNKQVKDITKLQDLEINKLIKVIRLGKLTSLSIKNLKNYKKDYLVIEIAGMPKSFKSTLILSSIVDLRTNSVTAGYIHERPFDIDKVKYPLHYNLGISNMAMKNLLANRNSKTVLFVDRGIYDRIPFLYAYRKLGKINDREFRIAYRYLIGLFGKEIDGLIVCHGDPHLSLVREGKRETPGPVMNKDFLTILSKAYKELPLVIPNFREKVGLGRIPLPIAQLDSTTSWENYADSFIRTVRKLYVSSKNIN